MISVRSCLQLEKDSFLTFLELEDPEYNLPFPSADGTNVPRLPLLASLFSTSPSTSVSTLFDAFFTSFPMFSDGDSISPCTFLASPSLFFIALEIALRRLWRYLSDLSTSPSLSMSESSLPTGSSASIAAFLFAAVLARILSLAASCSDLGIAVTAPNFSAGFPGTADSATCFK